MIRSLRDLEGYWRFTREVHHADGALHLVDGAASFTRRINDVLYHETGVLRFGDKEFHAERSYLYSDEADGFVRVSFEDGSFFHRFSFDAPAADHLCIDDLYQVRYEFGENQWQAHWRVKGPRKDYKMITQYSK